MDGEPSKILEDLWIFVVYLCHDSRTISLRGGELDAKLSVCQVNLPTTAVLHGGSRLWFIQAAHGRDGQFLFGDV